MTNLNQEDEGCMRGGPVLSVRELGIELTRRQGRRTIARELDLEIEAGETVGITGPSGSGKTLTVLALLGLDPVEGKLTTTGSIRLLGRELNGVSDDEWRQVRRSEVGFVPQDAAMSLTPVRRVGDLLVEVQEAHTQAGSSGSDVGELLAEVGFDDPETIGRMFPHELSGGMQQRVAIAAALAGDPALIVADEPTSSLDTIGRMELMEMLASIQDHRGLSMLLVSHDRRTLGRRVERWVELVHGTLSPLPPGSGAGRRDRRFVSRAPALDPSKESASTPEGPPILSLEDVSISFDTPGGDAGSRSAVHDVTLSIRPGESIGLVGPNGCGKTTLARCAVRLQVPSRGSVQIHGTDVTGLPERRIRSARRALAMVFQNPSSSLNPKRPVGAAIEAPLRHRRVGPSGMRRELVLKVANTVRLEPELLARLPGELSGGELQRVVIARALVTDPELLILDEPFSSLDEENENNLTDLLNEIRSDRELAILLISHDIGLVGELTEWLAVMNEGTIIESGPTHEVMANPEKVITKRLLAARSGNG